VREEVLLDRGPMLIFEKLQIWRALCRLALRRLQNAAQRLFSNTTTPSFILFISSNFTATVPWNLFCPHAIFACTGNGRL
jgi:hypothetical protein